MPRALDLERPPAAARGAQPRLAAPTLPRWTTGAAVVALFVLVECILLGSHFVHGGIYTDDWWLVATQRHSGAWGAFTTFVQENQDAPLSAAYYVLTIKLSGTNAHLYALWGLLTLLGGATAVYALLRELTIRRRDAVVLTLLVIAFPFADSAWLWYADSLSYLAIALAAIGGIVAIRGIRRTGRPAIAYHVAALLLFVLSVLTYQIAAFVICLSVVAYLRFTTRRRAILWWLADVSVMAVTLVLPRLITGSHGSDSVPIIPLAQQLHHARLIASQSVTLLSRVLVPFGHPRTSVVVPIVLVIVAGGVLVVHLPTTSSVVRREGRRWLATILVGVLVVVAAYLIYVPGPIIDYAPLQPGQGNRVNVMASFGYVLIVLGLAMTSATVLIRVLRARLKWIPVIGLVIVGAVFAGYARHTRTDVAAWNRAGMIQLRELGSLRAAGRPAPNNTVYTFGGVGTVAPGVVGFIVTWDLDSAVKILWHDPTLDAFPIFAGAHLSCDKGSVIPDAPDNDEGPTQAARYGHAIFYDFRTGRRQSITSAQTCAQAVGSFVPGPEQG